MSHGCVSDGWWQVRASVSSCLLVGYVNVLVIINVVSRCRGICWLLLLFIYRLFKRCFCLLFKRTYFLLGCIFLNVVIIFCYLINFVCLFRPIMQALMYLEILFPLFLLSLWIPPISRSPLIGELLTNLVSCGSVAHVLIVRWYVIHLCFIRYSVEVFYWSQHLKSSI